MTRVTLLTEIPAPYRIPLFNALADRVDLRVLFLARQNPERPYRLHEDELHFEWDVLPGADRTVGGRWLVLNRGLLRRLRGSDAVVLGGWNQPAFWIALAWARATRTPAYLWVESTLHDERTGAGSLLKRLAGRAASGFIVPGRASEEYVRAFAPRGAVTIAPNAVDTELFASRRADRDRLRSELGLEGFVLLYVGRLAPEKGVDVLLRALWEVEDAQLVLAGAGPAERRLRAVAPPGVRFLGNVERDELPSWYAAADALVLPSLSEPWGMSLNEGAAAGLPLVATDAAGAAHELIEDGVNGFRVPAADVGALRDALKRLVSDADFRRSAGTRSREISARFTPDAWADSVERLVDRQRANMLSEAELLVLSFPKSGRTWLSILIGKALCLHYGVSEDDVLRVRDLTKTIKAERDPRIKVTRFDHDRSSLNYRLGYRSMFADKSEFANKDVIFLVRDPRDVVVSYYFEATKRNVVFTGPISDFVRDEQLGVRKILAFNKNWYDNRGAPRSFQLFTYEQMHEDPHGVLRTTLEIMGVEGVSDDVIEQAVAFASFENMRELEQRDALGSDKLRPGDAGDPESFKVRKGEVGGHREYLSDDDVAYIDACLREMEYPL